MILIFSGIYIITIILWGIIGYYLVFKFPKDVLNKIERIDKNLEIIKNKLEDKKNENKE